MQGQYRLIGERPTYFPPFVNERFDDSWWSCTFASLLNAANVGFHGAQPATHKEVTALAKASGDAYIKDGSRSRHMIHAMRRRYEQTMQLSALPPRRVKRRLAHGWVLVAGLTYSQLPKQYRETDFKDGHRVLLIGWHNDHTWIVDPLHETDPAWTGRRIPWSAFEPAFWSSEQLWFRDGMFLPQRTYTEPTLLAPTRPWTALSGTQLDLLSPVRAGVVARQVQVKSKVTAQFDAFVGMRPPPNGEGRTKVRIRIATGDYRGYLLDPRTDGVDADLNGMPDFKGEGKNEDKAPVKVDAIARARQEEWKRIFDAVGPVPNFPDPPAIAP